MAASAPGEVFLASFHWPLSSLNVLGVIRLLLLMGLASLVFTLMNVWEVKQLTATSTEEFALGQSIPGWQGVWQEVGLGAKGPQRLWQLRISHPKRHVILPK